MKWTNYFIHIYFQVLTIKWGIGFAETMALACCYHDDLAQRKQIKVLILFMFVNHLLCPVIA
jgi:hypothetical protein